MTELIPLAQKYAEIVNGKPEKVKDLLINHFLQREVLRCVYQTFVNAKELTPIEDLPKEEKDRLWEYSKGIGLKQDRVTACKAAYLIETLTGMKL